MTIIQTIDVPEDRRVFFDVPREVPAGKAKFEIKVISFIKPAQNDIDKLSTPHSDALLSIFSGMGEVSLDEIRDERLAKHLKSSTSQTISTIPVTPSNTFFSSS